MSPRDPSFDDLIPELPRWNNDVGIDVDSWINAIGRHDHAIGYSRIFWPQFVTHEGCVLLADFDEGCFVRVFEATGGDLSSVERVLNRRQLLDFFLGHINQGEVVSASVLLYLGGLLEEMWTAKLRRDFPEVELVVCPSRGSGEDLYSYQITVFRADEDD